MTIYHKAPDVFCLICAGLEKYESVANLKTSDIHLLRLLTAVEIVKRSGHPGPEEQLLLVERT
jgi:hypothetical protein